MSAAGKGGMGPDRRAFRHSHSGSVRADVNAELRFHLEERIEEMMAQGQTRAQAEEEVKRRFGDPARIGQELETIDRAALRRRTLGEQMQGWARDVRYAARGIVARPGYALIVVLTLALAIGANTAIYSAVQAVLLRPLPVAGLDRLFSVQSDIPSLQLESGGELSVGEVVDIVKRTDLFESFTGFLEGNFTLSNAGEPRRVAVTRTVGDFAGVFGVRPLLGRFHAPEDGEPGRPAVAVLSYGFWQEVMGGEPTALGRTITLDDQAYEVIGVLPPEFRYPRQTQVWTPYVLSERALSPQRRASYILTAVGRAQPGATRESLEQQLRLEVSRWAEQWAGINGMYAARENGEGGGYSLRPMPFVEYLAGQLRTILLVLLGAVSFVLLIACANVASLQLVRTTGRAKEIAVRAALGAGRWPIVRQVMVESLIFALLGGALGILLGWATLRLVSRWDVASFAILRDVRLDGTVLAFTALVALLAGLVFGIVPAWRASRVDAQATLKESGARGASSGVARHRFLQGAVVAQLALTVVLLLGAGVMLRSMAQLLAVDPGFRTQQVTSLQITPGGVRYASNAARVAMYDEVLQRLDALPGVEAAGITTTLPFSDMIQDSSPFQIVGDAAPVPEGETRHANITVVGGDYFQALGVPLLRGRLFTPADDRDAPQVVIIDEELANRYFPNEDPVGRQIGTAEHPVTIVGVVGSIRQRELAGGLKATRFYPYHQMPWYPWAGLTVRGTVDPATMGAMVRSAIREIDPELPLFDMAPMQQRVEQSVGAQRMAVTVLAGFAALALALAVLGTYGVLSYSTSQRTHELGIRMALGAQPRDVVQMVLRNGVLLAGAGLIVGIAGYFALARLIDSMIFGVSARDPIAITAALSTLVVAALLATWVPARRAARVDPVVALRSE